MRGASVNPIHAWLDAIGLPWRSPRADLIARFGVTRDPAYDWEVIAFDTGRPVMEGLLFPLTAQVRSQFSPRTPATWLSGRIGFGDNAERNIALASRHLGTWLGRREPVRRYNTLHSRWTHGEASVELIAWPPGLQTHAAANPAHDRDPRLRTACHVSIDTGWLAPLTAKETRALKAWTPLASLPSAGDPLPTRGEGALAFQRDARGTPAQGRIGIGGGTLMFERGRLHVVPLADLVRFEVSRMLPAKGPGGATLSLTCRTDAPAGTISLALAAGAGATDLDPLATSLARTLGVPVNLGPFEYDC